MPHEDDSALERMRSRLYAADKENDTLEFDDLTERAPEVPRGWNPPADMPKTTHKSLPLSLKFLLGAIGFCVLAGLLTAFFLFSGGRSVSTDNIDFDIEAPVTAAGGDTVTIQIAIENRNPVAIKDTNFSVEFPEGTRSAEDVTKSFTRYADTLGEVESGKAVVRTVRATVFGAENTKMIIPVRLEYKTVTSNAVFVKEEDIELTITSSPMSVTATSISEVSSGQPLTISLSVRSNATEPLANIALKPEFPFGFTVGETSLPIENGVFDIGTLRAGQERKITVSGTLAGENGDERVFRWSAGSMATSTNGALGVVFATAQSSITITRPFFDVTLSLNNETSGTPIVAAGQTVQGVVRWRNTLSSSITDGSVVVALSGTAFDPKSVDADNGFYRSSDNTITFSRETDSGLRSIAPGDTGVGTFSFRIKSGSELSALRNPSANLTVSSSGRRTGESGVPETLTASLTRSIKIATGISLTSRAVRTVGPFANTGPLPPEPDKETTYTVMLTAQNDVNSIGGAVVTATLPSYVRFTGATNPNGSVTYAEATRTIKWMVGELGPNTTKQASFQVGFTPSSSQSGSSPMIVSAQSFTGTDRFTQANVTSTAPQLTIETTTDPSYDREDGRVE